MQPKSECCYLLLVRHGATANNVAQPPRLQGRRSDAELSEAGRQQSKLTADFLRPFALSAIYSSPLSRARQTAAEIAAPHGVPVTIVDGLTECDVGEWEGRSWIDIEREDPDRFRMFIADSAANPYAGGESLGEVRARIAPVFAALAEEHSGQAIAVVAHNVVNRVYLADLLGWPIAQARSIPQSNCGVNLIEHSSDAAKVLTINAALHLEPGLPYQSGR
jgi:broad specificity phosphatase PhoE